LIVKAQRGAEVFGWSVGVMECWGGSCLVIFVFEEENRDFLGLEVLGCLVLGWGRSYLDFFVLGEEKCSCLA